MKIETRKKRKYSFRGSKYLTEEQTRIAEKNGIERGTWIRRINLGWDVERAITEPPKKTTWETSLYALYKGENFIADGTVFEIAEATGKTISAVKALTTPSYEKKVAKHGFVNHLVMEYIGEEGEEDE